MAEPAWRHDFRDGLWDGSVVLPEAAGDPFQVPGCGTVTIRAVIRERECVTGREARVSCPGPTSIWAAAVSDGPVGLPAGGRC